MVQMIPEIQSIKLLKLNTALFSVLLIAATGCTGQGAKTRYILAEKLWNDGKYQAAVNEFEKVSQKDPESPLGLRALFRAATTQMLYLSEYNEAIRKFNRVVDLSKDSAMSWDAQKQIGEIYFSKTEQYNQAILHYKKLIQLKPEGPGVPEFTFRIAKSHFYLMQFDESIAAFKEIAQRYKSTPWAEKAAYEIGVTSFTRGGHPGAPDTVSVSPHEAYQEAMDSFGRFIKLYPESPLIPLAKFGIANCLEEMDQLDAAYHQYEAIRSTYPSSQVIDIKLMRIRERRAQRTH
ncbi:MAG: tetratricopeptide repeat protein [Methylotenera sp.]|nr:tetratricopeptide repeat protein [Oligoflexia bacterium]